MAPDDGIKRPDPRRDDPGAPELPKPTRVELERTERLATPDEFLWEVIKDRTQALSFDNYAVFMDALVADAGGLVGGLGAYDFLKVATELWLRQEAGVWLNPGQKEPKLLVVGGE